MADRFILVVDARGGRELRDVRRNLERADSAADRIGPALRRAFAVGVLTSAAVAFTRIADSMTNIENRIRTVTSGQQELNRSYEALFQVAQRTRSPLENLANVYSRIARAGRDFGLTNQGAIQVAGTLNRLALIGGSTPIESAQSIRQFTQGVGANRFGGDELRSVLEGTPLIAQAIADYLGVQFGDLRGIAARGGLTADVSIGAIREARTQSIIDFEELAPTIAQAGTVFSNAINDVVGDFDRLTGVTSGLAQSIILVSENLDSVLIALGIAGAGGGLYGLLRPRTTIFPGAGRTFNNPDTGLIERADVRRTVSGRQAAGQRLGAFFRNPFVRIGGGLAGLTSGLVGTTALVSDSVRQNEEREALLEELLAGGGVLAGGVTNRRGDFLGEPTLQRRLASLRRTRQIVSSQRARLTEPFESPDDIGRFSDARADTEETRQLIALEERLAEAIEETSGAIAHQIEVQGFLRRIAAQNAEVYGNFEETLGALTTRLEETNEQILIQGGGFSESEQRVLRLIARTEDLTEIGAEAALATDEAQALLKAFEDLANLDFGERLAEQARIARDEIVTLGGEVIRLGDQDGFDNARSRLLFNFSQRGATDRERSINARLGIRTLTDEATFNQRDDAEALRRLAGEEVDLEAARREEGRGRLGGRRGGGQLGVFSGLSDELILLGQIGDQVFGNLESAIDNFVRTGEFSFRQFAASVIADLSRIGTRNFITPFLSNALGLPTSAGLGARFAGVGRSFGNPVPGTFDTATFAGSFQSGGSFTVPGTGAVDRTLVSFAATAEEEVEVRPRGAGRATTVNFILPPNTNANTIRANRKRLRRQALSAIGG